MLSECKPSLACGYTLHLQHSTLRDPIPTRGHRVHCSLVRRPPSLTTRQTYNGLCGDVNSLRAEGSLELHKPLSRDLVEETGLVMHLAATGGCVVNLNRRKTRYFDRFFLSRRATSLLRRRDQRARLYARRLRTAQRRGGQSEERRSARRRLLSGARCGPQSAGGGESGILLRNSRQALLRGGQCVESRRSSVSWVASTLDLKSVWKKAKQSYGVGVVLPFLGKGVLELDYLINQKRFTFSASF